MRKLEFSKQAVSFLGKLDKATLIMLKTKIEWYMEQDNPLLYARKMINSNLGERRRRIGKYRVIFDCDIQGKFIIILIIGDRKNIYK